MRGEIYQSGFGESQNIFPKYSRPNHSPRVSSQNVGANPCGRPVGQAQGLPLPRIIEKIQNVFDSISVLSPYGVGVRYPGTASTYEQAKDAVEAMKETRKFFRKHLELDD